MEICGIEEAVDILSPKENIDLSNHFNNTRFFEAIYTLLTAYEKEKAKNKELTERVLRLESDKFWDNVVSKDKIKTKIEEVKDGTFDAKIVLQSLLEKE